MAVTHETCSSLLIGFFLTIEAGGHSQHNRVDTCENRPGDSGIEQRSFNTQNRDSLNGGSFLSIIGHFCFLLTYISALSFILIPHWLIAVARVSLSEFSK
jgi:hypothetical protein